MLQSSRLESRLLPHHIARLAIIICGGLLLNGCLGMPQNVKPVEGFSLERYLGTWYEIARLDHSFERGLEQVKAEYRLRDDGGVDVINQGVLASTQERKVARGKAYFVQTPQVGHLKVSFFGPFYGSYVIFELDHEGYEYAFVSGSSLSYLWLLARTPEVPPEVRAKFIEKAAALGFNVNDLIFVRHAAP